MVTEIRPSSALLRPVTYTGGEDLSEGAADDYQFSGDEFEVPCRFVFSLIGHRPDTDFLGKVMGLELQQDGRPVTNRDTWETSTGGIFVAGSLADPGIDVVLGLREQAARVVETIRNRFAETR